MTDPLDKKAMVFISSDTAIARSIVTTPDTPPERVAALRKAFDQVVKDPELLAEAKKSKQDISPMSGEEVQKVVNSIVDTPKEVIDRAKTVLVDPAKK